MIANKTIEEIVGECVFNHNKHGEDFCCANCNMSTDTNACPFGERPIDWNHDTLGTEGELE